MNFKLVSKNNIGIVVALLLVILLSQSKFFNFLLDTTLGRSILVFLILILAYVNKILGVVAVLFIIILLNQSDIGYLEGFTDGSGNKKPLEKQQPVKVSSTSTATAVTPSTSTATAESPSTSTATAASPSTSTATAVTPSTSTATAETPSTSTATAETPATTTPLATGAAEGFDIIGTENNIQRGKQSNKIPVTSHMRESMNVSAFDGSFSDNYSAF
jgi:cytoskeletal protein RodZ